MKTLIKILIIASSFFSLAFAQTVNPAVGSNSTLTTPCNYTLCSPFQNSDLQKVYQAIMVNGSGGGSVTGTVSVNCNTCTSTVAGNVGGYTAKVQSTLTIDGTVLSGKNIGGIITFTPSRNGQRSGIINDITIFDPDNAKASLVIDIWSSSPLGTFTSGSTQVISGSSSNYYVGSISISSGDYITTGSMARANITGLGISFYSAAGGSLYFTVQTTADATFGVNEKITFSYGILQD